PETGHNRRFSDLHGHGGEWRIEAQRLHWEILDDFATAATEAGIERTQDFNSGDNAGIGYFDVTQRSGWRWNTAKAFLRPARGRANLTVWTEAQVKALDLQPDDLGGLRCVGVALRHGREMVRVAARREVILSAGAIGSPQILQLSGIGPGALLQAHGIPVRQENAAIGENLQDHLQLRTIYKVSDALTLNTLAGNLLGKARIGLEYLFRRSGPM
ncbi:choline dehydrogenase, partial [Thioclava sp. BHET1]